MLHRSFSCTPAGSVQTPDSTWRRTYASSRHVRWMTNRAVSMDDAYGSHRKSKMSTASAFGPSKMTRCSAGASTHWGPSAVCTVGRTSFFRPAFSVHHGSFCTPSPYTSPDLATSCSVSGYRIWRCWTSNSSVTFATLSSTWASTSGSGSP
jgi:hypothetical protein